MAEKPNHQWITTSEGEYHEVRECTVCHVILQLSWWPETDSRMWYEVWKMDKTASCAEEE